MWIKSFPHAAETEMENNVEKKHKACISCGEMESKSLQEYRKRKYFKEESSFSSERQGDWNALENAVDHLNMFSRLENKALPKVNGSQVSYYSDVAIVPSQYPSRTFSKQEAEALLLQMAMGLDSRSTGYPRFVKHQFCCGAIVVSCLDEYSKNWLLQRTEECSPWKNTALRNCEITELERSFKIEIYIPEPIPASDVTMKWLANQNPDLDTSRWLILEEGGHFSRRHFVFKVPESSFRTVEKSQMMLYHGFDVAVVKCLGEMRDL